MDASPADQYNGRRCVVTGGLGFIGSNLCVALGRLGAEIVVVDNLVPSHGGSRDNVASAGEIDIFVTDVGDQALRAVVADAEIIFNLAGQVSHIDSMIDPIFDLEVNTRSHLAFLETLRAVGSRARIVYTSTRQVFGHPRYLPVDEDHPVTPVDVNGVSQYATEQLHMLYGDLCDLEACVLRLTNVFGPRQRLTGESQGFIPIFVRRALNGEDVMVYGEGRQVRDCLYVDDVVESLLVAGVSPNAPGQVFNIGNDELHTVKGIADAVVAAAGSGRVVLRPWPSERQMIAVGSYYTDSSKAKRLLGWSAAVPLREGIDRTVEYYRGQPARVS